MAKRKTVAHASRAHALLSASAAYRWMVCTPSARLEDKQPDEGSSEFAAEGTLAHEIAEAELLYHLGRVGQKGHVAKITELAESKYYSSVMPDEVEKYVDYVRDTWKEAQAVDPHAEILIEDRMDLREWVPEGFGTNDVVIIAGETLAVIDLKFGKGVRVKADSNPQLMLYALGALEKHGLNYDIKTVSLTIHQPRLNSVSEFSLSADELQVWAETQVKPKAKLAFEGKGDFTPGAHCQFCKAAPRCRALAAENLDLARHDFAEPAELTDQDLVQIFDKIDLLTKWAGKVSKYILDQAIGGKTWPGLKLVEGRSVRQIKDEEAVSKALEAAGLTPDKFTNVKLKGLTDLTKLLGKADFQTLVGPYIVKPAGKPTLAAEDDPRPAITSIEHHAKDFE